jgi:hypothetical protein
MGLPPAIEFFETIENIVRIIQDLHTSHEECLRSHPMGHNTESRDQNVVVERKVMGRLCQLLWCGRGPIICGI